MSSMYSRKYLPSDISRNRLLQHARLKWDGNHFFDGEHCGDTIENVADKYLDGKILNYQNMIF